MQVNEVMTPAPTVVRESTSVGEAWEMLRSLDVRHLPVVNEDRELVGILSDRDLREPPPPPLMTELLGVQPTPLEAPVATVMSASPISVDEEDDLDDVVDIMLENKIGAVPVVDPDGKVVGIVSYLDVLRTLHG